MDWCPVLGVSPHPPALLGKLLHDDVEETMGVTDHETVEEPDLTPPTFKPPVEEKPLFHDSRRPPSASVPYKLSISGESIPYTINRYLRDYQREGVCFIYNNYVNSRGCILGDDMGLGKTIQVIAFLAAVLHKTGTWDDVENNVPHFLLSQRSSKPCRISKVFLIVAPLSVLYNWKDELDTWGHFRIIVVHGTRKEEEFARVRRGRCEIALTTYETLRLCMDQFNSINWSAIIVDEVHRLKNPNSQITQAMKEMKCKVRIGLTGTILQNNLEELWCVMDWANPGCLGSLECFRNRFAEPIERGQRRSTTKRALALGREAVRQLSRQLIRWFLRRTKALIWSQLPKKEDRVVFCSLTDFQETVYRTVLDSEDVSLLLRSGERCCGSGRTRSKCCFKNNSKGVPVKDVYFSYLAILRKVANHVALLQPRGSTSKKQEQYVNEICEKVFQKFPGFTQRCKQAAFEAMSDPVYSGKMKVLQRLLNHYVQNKDKVLLFSISTKLLDILESYCMAAGIEYRRLDGTTKSKDRVKIVKEFNSSLDINICLVSTMAGGLGLNFVGANIVVLFDPTWNPASDLQAVDRAYRIGQYRDVTVLRLISLGTVEEIIYLRQVYKQQLQSAVVGKEHARRYFEAIQGPDGHSGELFGVRNLFRLQTQGTCLTKQILEVIMDEEDAHRKEGHPACSTHPKWTVSSDSEGDLNQNECENRMVSGARKRDPNNVSRGPQVSAAVCRKLRAKRRRVGQNLGLGDPWESESSSDNAEDVKRITECLPGSACKAEHNADETGETETPKPMGQTHASNLSGTADNGKKHYRLGSVKAEHLCQPLAGMDLTCSGHEGLFKANKSQADTYEASVHKAFTTNDPRKTGRTICKGLTSEDAVTVLLPSDGVQEVVYIHSNQHVVGSSKVEERLSRAAIRDVFCYRRNSQAPANQLLESMEVKARAIDHAGAGPQVPSVKHPVTQTLKTVHRTRNVTFIIGETPSAIRRRELEEMATFFKAASVQDFAEDLLKSTSDMRQAMLKDFYSSRSPDLKALLSRILPDPVVAQPSSPTTAKQFQPRTSLSSVSRKQKTSCAVRSYGSRSKSCIIHQKLDVAKQTSPERERDKGCLNSRIVETPEGYDAHLKGTSESGPLAGPSNKLCKKSNKPSSTSVPTQDLPRSLHDNKALLGHENPPTFSSSTGSELRSHKHFLSDLIGDTSILDDFFQRKPKTAQPTGLPAASRGERSKNRCRDVWDILNEGNEECINKLTDLSQVEMMCKNAKVAGKAKHIENSEGTQLWRKNEKFLWKK
uniref:Excision repair cross-complementation group 6-like 2 n=1 Tax=Scleropages formosus TaxID=113540 RepID=A0A8C9R6U9_SCLFO